MVFTDVEQGNALVFNGVGTESLIRLMFCVQMIELLFKLMVLFNHHCLREILISLLIKLLELEPQQFFVTGITSIYFNDLVNIDNEILEITGVGIGSTNALKVKRGVLGSVAIATILLVWLCTMRGGSFHIVKDVIHFVTPPYGKVGVSTFQPGISTNSTFAGRVFNRKDPTTNFIFDDISDNFTGVGKTFTLLQDGADVSGIVTTVNGPEVVNNGVILINNIFQRPEVDYDMTERS